MDEDERTRRLKEVFGFPGDQIAMRKLGEVFADDIYQAMNRPGVLASLFKVEEMPKEDQEKLWKQLESKLGQYND